MIKRAVITDEISQDIGEAAALAAKYRLDGVELRTVGDKLPHQFTEADIREIKKACGEYGLRVCALSAPCFKCALDDDGQFGEHLAIFRKTAQTAAAFGLAKIRGFTFWKKGSLDEALPLITERYRTAVEIARETGMTIVIEQDPSVFATNAAGVRKVIEAIDDPRVRALWDGGNDVYDPAGEESYPFGYETIKPYIAHVHIKDAVKKDSGITGVRIGDGEARVFEMLERLAGDGYGGWVSLETHYRLSSVISEESLKNPGGSSFSDGGYEATEECLAAWNERHFA